MTLLRPLLGALAFVAIAAATPARLEAQQREPSGIQRPALAPQQSWRRSCAVEKVMIVGALTAAGFAGGAMLAIVASAVRFLTQRSQPNGDYLAGGMKIGFAVGVVVAIVRPCRQSRAPA